MTPLKTLLSQANSDLAKAKRGVKVVVRGARLYLVATLPCKVGESTSSGRKQYRIPTGLGYSEDGIEDAEDLALELSRDIRRDRFSWAKWSSYSNWVKGGKGNSIPLATAIEDFRMLVDERWQASGREKVWRDEAWKYEYLSTCLTHISGKRLEQRHILENLRRYPPNTKSRQRATDISRRLVELAQKNYPDQVAIDIDWGHYRGHYSPTKTSRRVPDSDQQIIDCIDMLPHPPWRRIYATMAIFGIRDHECWHCSLEKMGRFWVANIGEDTKTNSRQAFPIVCADPDQSPVNFELMEQWVGLIQKTPLPTVTATRNKLYGERTAHYFRKYDMPFEPYGLRHAAVKRGVDLLGMPMAVVARSMGNSVAMIERVYRAQTSPEEQAALWEKLLG